VPQLLTRVLSRYEPRPREEEKLMRLSELFSAAFPGEVPDLPETTPVSLITADSRQCRPGSVFVAIPGTAVDGARYASEAVDRGDRITYAKTPYALFRVRRGHDISEDVKQRLLASNHDILDVVVHLEPYEGG